MRDALVLDDVALIGRTYSEYSWFFGLNTDELEGEKILDVGAGVSSFCAEARAQGLNATALDPIYAHPMNKIKDKSKTDLINVMAQMSSLKHMYNWGFYKNLDKLGEYRRDARRLFLEHYRDEPANYINSSLPDTGLCKKTYTITLVSHLLFLYEDDLDYDFHKRSVLELLRITSREIRIYPIVNLQGIRSNYVDRLIQDRDLANLQIQLTNTNFEFLRNATEMIVINHLDPVSQNSELKN